MIILKRKGKKMKGLNDNLHLFIVTIIILFYLPHFCFAVSGTQFYADVIIDVTDSGFVTIEGSTNHPDLLVIDTQNYTSKTQSYWFLNITKDEVFSDFIFTLTLPQSSVIYYVKSSGTIWIEEKLNRLVVNGFVQNKSFYLNVQYQITQSSEDNEANAIFDYINLLLIFIIILIVILIILVYNSTVKKEMLPDKKNDEYMKGLSERQKEIMKLLLDSKVTLTQTDIEKKLHIPKAAVSRNIHSLELKGLIEIEKIGMSNFIKVKKS